MVRNGAFWARYFDEVFVPAVEALVAFVRDRVLPLFANAEEEADEAARREWERLGKPLGGEDVDPGDLAEKAFEAGLAYYETMQSMKQTMLNLAAVGIYHLFEQQVMVLYRRELLEPTEEDAIIRSGRAVSLEDVKMQLKTSDYQVDLDEAPVWPVIEELRMVANTVKHGEGPSAYDLRLRRPDLFVRDRTEKQPARNVVLESLSGHVFWPVSQPLAGTDLYVSPEDITKYGSAVKEFWRWLGARMMCADS